MDTLKSRTFANEPMGDKDVSKLGGIGRTTEKKMRGKGINKAYQVVGKYLCLEKNENEFKDWIQEFGANEGQAEACYHCVNGWCVQHT